MSWQILSILLLWLAGMPGSAERAAPPPDNRPINPRDLETFLDEFFREQIKTLHIPGAAFVLVKDGKIPFTKGYGFANLQNRTPVMPEQTVFRVASVSKLFTATAVMQLVERGSLNLNDDVNKYLKLFQLPEDYPRPVTIAHLLTHTAGFGERYIGMAARRESDVVPLGQYLAARMPPRVMPPGDTISYSNHGIALAGHLVEVISGVPFARYVEENILKPLGMSSSSFLAPNDLKSRLAVGYEYKNGTYRPFSFDYGQIAPAGSLISTASDMARFMIAHLQDGRYGSLRILSEATAHDMHGRHFTHHPRLPGFAYGFYEYVKNGQRAIMHDGDWGGFGSRLFLLPEQNLGLFVSYNNDHFKLREELVKQFLDRFFPVQEKQPIPPTGELWNQASRFTGFYRVNRYPRHTFDKLGLLYLLGSEFRVTADAEGRLTVHDPREFGDPVRYVPVEPLLFRSLEDESYVAFRENREGRITRMFLQFAGPASLEKLSWYETAAFQSRLAGFIAIVFLSACAAWVYQRLIRRLRKPGGADIGLSRLARILGRLVSALNVIFLSGLPLTLAWDPIQLTYGVPGLVIGLLCIPLLTSILTIGLPICAVLAWKNGYWSITERLHYSLITLAALVFIPFLLYWNLLGFRY